MKYAWIKAHRQEFNVSLMCNVFGVGRTSYYDWLISNKDEGNKQATDMLSSQIKDIFFEHRATYGTRRIKKVLANQGMTVSRRRIGTLMRATGLCCKTKRKFKVSTTDSNHDLPVAPNLLARDFSANKPNLKYVGDITYVWTKEGWMYLAVVIDLYSRRIVGWAMDSHMRASLVNDALLMAIWQRKPKPGLIWHTDRGSQYASESHRKILKRHGIIQSMSRRANCWDNAVAESFFHTIKTELIHHFAFDTREEARKMIFEYIEVFFNQKRMHSANDYYSPSEFEKAAENF